MDIFDLPGTHSLIDLALTEDLSLGDVTSEILLDTTASARGEIRAKQSCVIAGQGLAQRVFKRVDTDIQYTEVINDGYCVQNGDLIATITGPVRAILSAERLALNFLQRLSGIATITQKATRGCAGTDCLICDTRKTTPGMRLMEKYAVAMGGGKNHRISLGDGILIKDNHIQAVGGIEAAIKIALKRRRHPLKVQIEVTCFDEAVEAVEAGTDALLLDNMTVELVQHIADKFRNSVFLEASGNMTLDRIPLYARTGVHIISAGFITHSAPAVDLSLNLV